MTTADAVADHLLALAHRRGEAVNNLKLQKLLYYAQAWHLALHGEPLFAEKFEAWMSGPVIPRLFWKYDDWGIRSIAAPASLPRLAPGQRAFLCEMAGEYLPLDEYELADLVYRELPWKNARRGLGISEPCETELSEDDMRVYFQGRAEAA